MSHQSEQDKQMHSIITSALINRSIIRTDFNVARRSVLSMSAETRAQWNDLNEALFYRTVQIVEDGDTIFEVPVSLDKSGHVIDTF